MRPKSYNALKVAVAAIFFGSDWPVCDLAGGLGPWLTAINALLGGVSIADRQKLFVSNAARIYRTGVVGESARRPLMVEISSRRAWIGLAD